MSSKASKPKYEFERRLIQAGNNPLPESELVTPAEPEDYIFYIGRPWPRLSTPEAEFVAILHGTKSKVCRWNYTVIHSDGKGGEKWVHVENYHPPDHYRCDHKTIKYQVMVIKTKDLKKYDHIFTRYQADCSRVLCHAVLLDCLEYGLIELPKVLTIARDMRWSMWTCEIRKLRLPNVP
ncbi:uncharacterized protein DSM5745_04022 [Aspergillus mulundensis]|uniref:Uncharacterized protein n=1 Tax=Aspergillus mulundensis TaxID=1810919 RepID=A0A3D8SBK4_9EURO|nr:hypothetical protein DSM5745_04022 [Aspergillus mulundensis]RDW83696.1 hypothetical protein DSM5745_04022 [Aspergillus mulundensis]